MQSHDFTYLIVLVLNPLMNDPTLQLVAPVLQALGLRYTPGPPASVHASMYVEKAPTAIPESEAHPASCSRLCLRLLLHLLLRPRLPLRLQWQRWGRR